MYTPTLVEYLGTCLLVGTVAFTGAPLLIVSALAIAISFGGKISGGHFNPAITIMAFLSGKLGRSKTVAYLLAQLCAALTIWVLGSLIKV